MRYKVVVFDFDGTLADSFPSFLEGMNEVAKIFGYRSLEADRLAAMRNLSARQFMKELGIPFWKIPKVGEYVKNYIGQNAERISLFPSVTSLLPRLKKEGVTVVILTSNTRKNVTHILGESLAAHIDHFACDVGIFGKKRRLQKLMKGEGWKAHEVLLVGDEIRDAEAARALSVDFCGVAWGFTNPEALGPYSRIPVLRSLDEMSQILAGEKA